MTATEAAAASDQRPAFGSAAIVDILERVDRLLARAVEAAAATAGSATESLRGLFISDAEAGRLVERGPQPLGSSLGSDRPIVDLRTAGVQWRRVAGAFALSNAEIDILALALAPELDLRYERIYGYLHDDVTKRRLTPDLACQLLCDTFDERLAARGLFSSEGALRRWNLIHLAADNGQPDGSIIGRGVRLDEGIVDLLLDENSIDRRLGNTARWEIGRTSAASLDTTAAVQRMLRVMRRAEGAPEHVVLVGSDTRLNVALAQHVARELEQPLLVVDLHRLTRLEIPFATSVLLAVRTAQLFGGITLWTRAERAITGIDAESVARLDTWTSTLDALGAGSNLLAVAEPLSKFALGDRFLTLELPMPDGRERRMAWERCANERGIELGPNDSQLLAEVFRMDGGAIEKSVNRAVTTARWRDSDASAVTVSDLFAAGRLESVRALPRYATRIDLAQRWEDIVLPPDCVDQLRELCNRIHHRHRVLDEWGFSRRLTLGQGVAALFSGPSGTGKTMAAQIIAATLGMDLYRVEIPSVVSKYIGETEKALEQLFREAQGTSVILFFDEADALFGKRSEVKDAHDRYANIEISYLLQAIEQYDGLTILATNLRHNMDEAFVRRLAFSVTFPFPEEPERRRIWEKCWPAQAPMDSDVDAAFLARQFKLTGGNIRNVALAAAFDAAADGGRVSMSHIVRGVRREFQKMGKTCVESDFGPYFPLLQSQSQ